MNHMTEYEFIFLNENIVIEMINLMNHFTKFKLELLVFYIILEIHQDFHVL